MVAFPQRRKSLTHFNGRHQLAALVLFLAAIAPGCRAPKVAPPGAAPTPHPYWGALQAGWRVRVVTPILKSGGYVVQTSPAQVSRTGPEQAVISIDAGPDFVGYQVSIYDVKPRRGGGVGIKFKSAEVHEQGQVTPSRRPILLLFRLPRRMRWVRILHLIRSSQADHDAAILAATRKDLLNALTQQVQSRPSNCAITRNTYCYWVPLGIAVRPEYRGAVAGKQQWIPAL